MSFNERNTTDNLSGIAQLEYVYKEDVASIDTDVVLKTGKVWNTIPFTKRSVQPNTKQKETDGGILYNTLLKFKIPRDEKAFADELVSISSGFILVRETDQNGTVRIIGSDSVPARLIFEISKIGYNGYDCEITCVDISPPLYID